MRARANPMEGPSVRGPDNPATLVAQQARRALASTTEVFALGVLLTCYLLIYWFGDGFLEAEMNVIGPFALMTILMYSAYAMFKKSRILIWTPLFWFRLAAGVYFGFGALVPYVVNESTLAQIFNLYFFDARVNFKVNVIFCLGVFVILFLSSRFFSVFGKKKLDSFDLAKERETLFNLAVAFLCAGAVVRYGFVVPYGLGFSKFVLPGSVATLGRVFYVGIFLMIVYGLRYNRQALYLSIGLVLFEILISIATFSKGELLLVMVFAFIGFIYDGAGKAKLLAGVACILVAYSTFQPLVGYGRQQVARQQVYAPVSVSDRLKIVEKYIEGEYDVLQNEAQGGLSRLSYTNIATFVVNRYDFGFPGDTLDNAIYIFIPRLLWPGKPIMTSAGVELNYLVFGSETSSLGVTQIAEAYWNYGWFGVVLISALLGLIYSLFSLFSLRVMAQRDWLMLPVVFLGVVVGFRVDGTLTADVLGACWIAICLGLAIYGGRQIYKSQFAARMRARRAPARRGPVRREPARMPRP